jgi:hypothetical protein
MGGMRDEPSVQKAYGWVRNKEDKNLNNPDLLAIVGTVIRLLYKDGAQYKINGEGEISAR